MQLFPSSQKIIYEYYRHDKVKKITEEKVDLIELIQGALGDWVEREASLAITE